MGFAPSGLVGDDVSITTNSSGQLEVDGWLGVVQAQAEQQIDIIELQATATLSGMTHDTLISDTYSDSNGYKNTRTGGTATYDSTNKRYSASVTENILTTLGSSFASADSNGIKYTPSQAVNILAVVKHSSSTATRARLLSAAGSLIASASFSSNTATFSTPQTLASGTAYRIEIDNSGSSMTHRYAVAPGFPLARTYGTVNAGSQNGLDDGTNLWNVTDITLTAGVKTIIHSLSVTGTVTAVEVVLNRTTDSGDAATFTLSDGTTTVTAQAVNSKITFGSVAAPTLTLTINITPASSPSATGTTVKSYCMKMWKD